MSRSQLWTMCQYAGMATSGETNCRFKFLLGERPDRVEPGLRSANPIGAGFGRPLARHDVGNEGGRGQHPGGYGTRGDPESPLRWTCKNIRNLSDELNRMGHKTSHRMVSGCQATDGDSRRLGAVMATG
jgi:hypothetical protein